MSVDRDFKVGIEADASQAVQATKQVTDETERYEAALRKMAIAAKSAEQVQKRETVEKQAEAVKDVTAEVDKAEKASSSWKKAIQALGREFPLLGAAGRFAMDPIVGTAVAATMVFGLAKKALDDWNAAMDETAARNAQRDFLPGIEAKAEAMRQGLADAAEWQRKLAEIEKEDAIAKSYSNALAGLKEYLTGLESLTQAKEERDLKRVEQSLKRGDLTPSQAEVQKNQIKERYRLQSEQEKTAGENEQLKLMQSELADRLQKESELASATEAARLRRQQIKEQLDSATKDEAVQRVAYQGEDGKSGLNEKARKFGAGQKPVAFGPEAGPEFEGVWLPKRVEDPEILDAEKALIAQANVARGAWQAAKEKARLGELGLGAADDTLASKQKEESENREAIKRLKREIETTQESLSVRQGMRKAVSAVKGETATSSTFVDVAKTDVGKEVAIAAETADAMVAGKRVSAQAKAHLLMLVRALEGTDSNIRELNDAVIKGFSKINDSLANFKAGVQQIETNNKNVQKSLRRD